MENFSREIIVFLGFAGFLLAFYIRHKKKSREKMVCPMKFNCDDVIYSKYSKFLGIPLEILGLLYYGGISISYGLFVIYPNLATTTISILILVITSCAFLFSIYLTVVQAFVLKKWCSWCLFSASLCVAIFLAGFYAAGFSF